MSAPSAGATPQPPATGRLDVGIHPSVPEHVYHSDCAIEISASASILRALYTASPEHAWTDHPRLNPAFEPSASTDAQAAGSILHWHMTEAGERPYRPLAFDSYRTDKAKATRDETIARGLIPILEHKLDELLPVADALRRRIEREHPELHTALHDPDTLREATLIWRENGTMARCRHDVLPPRAFRFAADFKFTGRSAEPEGWSKTLRENYLFQADLYPRAVKALRGDAIEFRFVVCETEPPYGVSVHALGPELIDIAHRRVNVALAQWAACLKANEWPGYASLVHYAEAPPWLDIHDGNRANRNEYAAKVSTGTIAQLHRIAAEIGSPIR